MKTIPGPGLRSFPLAVAFLAGLGGLGFGSHASAQAAQHAYLIDLNSRTATDLGTLGGNYSIAYAINDAGQVVGESGGHAFITGPDGVGMRDLGTLDSTDSVANDINQAGQATGTVHDNRLPSFYEAFVTGPNGVNIRSVGEGSSRGINDTGQMAVTSIPDFRYDTTFSAFITGPNGTGMRDLGTLGGESAIANDINNVGQVVGESDTKPGYTNVDETTPHAFITGPDGTGMKDLGTLGGDSSTAFAIDAAGQAAGASTTAEGDTHAFITDPDGAGMRDLGTLGGDFSIAYAINDAGQVVGDSATSSGIYHAFITGSSGVGMTDLNSLIDFPKGIILTEARGINNAGQIVAVGTSPISAIPEPESYALLLAGLALVGAVAWRKKHTGSLPVFLWVAFHSTHPTAAAGFGLKDSAGNGSGKFSGNHHLKSNDPVSLSQ